MSDKKDESFYKSEILKKVSETELEEWLSSNPPPTYLWVKYAWAFLEMPVPKWLRKLSS